MSATFIDDNNSSNSNNNISLLKAMPDDELTWNQSYLDVTHPSYLDVTHQSYLDVTHHSYLDVTHDILNTSCRTDMCAGGLPIVNMTVEGYLGVTHEILNTSSRTDVCVGGLSVGNMTVEEYLDCLNTSFADRLLPAVAVLAVLMAMGVVGNILVLCVYTCKSKRGTVTLFIQALAVFDLLSCCVAIPGEIIDMTNNYTFGSYSLCKIMRTVNLFCTVSSGAILVVVAIDRYKRICCPLRRQITPKGATVVICICAISTLVISIPTAILYGGRSIATDLPSVNGTDCSISDQFVNTLFPLAHNVLQMFLFLVGAVALIVLYSLIGSKVCHHVNQQQVRRKSIYVGRSRFSPGGASTTSVYSLNTNTVYRVESGLASFVNGREAAELAERFQSTNTRKDVTMNVRDIPTGKEKGNCGQFNDNNGWRDGAAVTDFTSGDASLSIHETDCQIKGASVVECGLESTTTTFQPRKNKVIETCNAVSGRNLEVELVKIVPNVKNLVEEGEINEFTQTTELGLEKQIVGRIEGGSVPESHRSNNTTNNDVSVVSSTLESHLKSCQQAEVSADIFVSAAGVACSQRDTCSQSVHKLSHQNVTSLSAQNDDLKNCAWLIADATNVPCETSIRFSSAIPSELSDKSTDGLLTRPSTDSESCKLSHLRNEGIDIKRPHDISKQYKKASNLSPLQSDRSNSKNTLQANNTFLIQTSKSKEINLNLDGKECKNLNNQIANSNNLVLRPKTKKKAKSSTQKPDYTSSVGSSTQKPDYTSSLGSSTQKPDYTSTVGSSKTPLVRHMSRTAGRSDGHLDRPEEKVKVREKEQSGSRRTTLMLLMITVIYVLSFLPHLIIMALKAVDRDTLQGLGSTWELAENLLIRSYFINSMANPVIYSFFSRNFFRRCRGSRSGWSSG